MKMSRLKKNHLKSLKRTKKRKLLKLQTQKQKIQEKKKYWQKMTEIHNNLREQLRKDLLKKSQ